MDPLDELWRHIRLCLVFGFRLRLVSFGLRHRCVSLGLRLWLGLGFRRRCVSFGHRLRCVNLGLGLWLGLGFRRRGVSFGFRLRLTFGFIIPNLLLRLLPVLNCCTVVAGSLLVEFVGSLSDLWRQIGSCLGFGLRLVSFGSG